MPQMLVCARRTRLGFSVERRPDQNRPLDSSSLAYRHNITLPRHTVFVPLICKAVLFGIAIPFTQFWFAFRGKLPNPYASTIEQEMFEGLYTVDAQCSVVVQTLPVIDALWHPRPSLSVTSAGQRLRPDDPTNRV